MLLNFCPARAQRVAFCDSKEPLPALKRRLSAAYVLSHAHNGLDIETCERQHRSEEVCRLLAEFNLPLRLLDLPSALTLDCNTCR